MMETFNNFHELIFAFIGSGTMAESMISALISQELTKPQDIHASGPRAERGQELQMKYGIVPFTDNSSAASNADIIIICTKPQRINSVLKSLLKSIKPTSLIISIVAGTSLQQITTGLDHKAVIRAMPNTPAQIGAGITVWTASKAVSTKQLAQAKLFLLALGEEIFLEDETYLDMATALSGTGPAYVYLFVEALIDAGVHLGFPRRIAEQLVIKTIQGSLEFYSKSESHPSALRNAVTSPGGTSAEAIYFLEKAGFRTAISRAIWAAYERSLELGSDHPESSFQKHN
ncbi:pyrroline-5-carboxylate reductase [Chloroflexota bacterium]